MFTRAPAPGSRASLIDHPTLANQARYGTGDPIKACIRHDRFRPCYLDRLAAGLDEQGRPSVWAHRTTSGTVRRYFDEGGWPEGKLDKDAVEGAWDSPYAFPAIRVDWIRHDPPVKLNWWRGVGPTHNVFVVESFLDELAHAAGQDPIAYRRALLGGNPRAMAVLKKGCRRGRLDQAVGAEIRARGVAASKLRNLCRRCR